MWGDANFEASGAVLTFAHLETHCFSQNRRHPFAEAPSFSPPASRPSGNRENIRTQTVPSTRLRSAKCVENQPTKKLAQ
jgi:hypothetical protein